MPAGAAHSDCAAPLPSCLRFVLCCCGRAAGQAAAAWAAARAVTIGGAAGPNGDKVNGRYEATADLQSIRGYERSEILRLDETSGISGPKGVQRMPGG